MKNDFTPFGYRLWDALGTLCETCAMDVLQGEGLHGIEARHLLHGEVWDIAPLWPVRKHKNMNSFAGYGIATSYEEKYNNVLFKKNECKMSAESIDSAKVTFYTLLFCSLPQDGLYFPECDNSTIASLFGLKELSHDALLRVIERPDGTGFEVSDSEEAIQVYYPNVQIAPNMRGPITRMLRQHDAGLSASCIDVLSVGAGDADEENEKCTLCDNVLMVSYQTRCILADIDFPALLQAMQDEDPQNRAYGLIAHDFRGMYSNDVLDWYISHTQRLQDSRHGIDPDFKKRTVYRVLCRLNSLICLQLSKPGRK